MRPYYKLSGKWGLTQLSTGQPFFIDTNTRDIASWILLGGTWENFVDDLMCALVKPGDRFIDVGANMGYYTVKIGGLVGPEGRLYAFEANPLMFEMLQENVLINGFSQRAQIFNLAAGSGPGRLTLAFDRAHPGGGSLLMDGQLPGPGIDVLTVDIVSIDSQLAPDCAVDLIKIDVEGFEPMALEGLSGILSRSPDAAIVCEVAMVNWARFGDPLAMLDRFADGRRIFHIFHDGHIEELEAAVLVQTLDANFVAYVLLLPRSERRTAEIDAFLQRF